MKKKSIEKVLIAIQDICYEEKNLCTPSCKLYNGLCYGYKHNINISELEHTVKVIKEKLDE